MSTTKETIGPRGTVPGFRPLIGSEKWHRPDFTLEMLEGGWRPHLDGEADNGDEMHLRYGTQWENVSLYSQLPTCSQDNHRRTRRPLPPPQVETFEAHGHVWYRHVPGDPCPVEPGVVVDCLYKHETNDDYFSGPAKAREWSWMENDGIYDIIGYRFPDHPAVHTSLQKQQASAEPVAKTEQSFQPKFSDEDARDLAYMKWAREPSIGQGLLAVWDAAWQAAKLHYTAQCSLPAASADSPPTPAA